MLLFKSYSDTKEEQSPNRLYTRVEQLTKIGKGEPGSGLRIYEVMKTESEKHRPANETALFRHDAIYQRRTPAKDFRREFGTTIHNNDLPRDTRDGTLHTFARVNKLWTILYLEIVNT